MRTNPDYGLGLPGGLGRRPHFLMAPNNEPKGHGIGSCNACNVWGGAIIGHRGGELSARPAQSRALSFAAYCPIEVGGHASARRRGCNWFLAVADGPKGVGHDVPTSRP